MRRYHSLTIIFFLALTADLFAENAVRFSDAAVQPGGQFSVDMLIENDVILGGATVPFQWTSSDIQFDSVVVIPGRWQGEIRVIYQETNFPERYSAVTFIRSLVPGEIGWIPVGTESIASLHFSVSPGAEDQYAFIDSVYHVVNDQPIRWVNWSSFQGELIRPSVHPGRIKIGNPADVTMSVTPLGVTLTGETGDLFPASRTLRIESPGATEFDWGASWSTSWLELVPSVGRTPSFPSLNADPFLLPPGVYQDTLVIASELAENSPVLVPVLFVVDTQSADPPEGFNFALGQSRPSPYVAYNVPETKIPFLLEEPAHVEIKIFDILGREVRTLTSRQYQAGEASVIWDGRDTRGEDVASGHYICRMKTPSGELSRVIVLIR